ncbi:MAG: hypothetical protein AB1422_15780 [bacterium]
MLTKFIGLSQPTLPEGWRKEKSIRKDLFELPLKADMHLVGHNP